MPDPAMPTDRWEAGDAAGVLFGVEVLAAGTALVLPAFWMISRVAAMTMAAISARDPRRACADHSATAACLPAPVGSFSLGSAITVQGLQTHRAQPNLVMTPVTRRARTFMPRYSVTAKPNSKKGPLVEVDDAGNLTVFVRERAVDGAANDGLILALAKHFGVPKTRVVVVRGHSSRHKIVDVDN
jgi:uncharacterized protein YggU (UPF0235/DUF167 family)